MSLFRSTAVVGSATLLSRLLGFVRDVVFANTLGAGAGSDAFFVAFKVPNFFRRLFAEGAFAQAFVPVLSACRTQQSHAEVRALVAASSGTLGLVLLLLTLLALLAADSMVLLFAPGWAFSDGEKAALTADLLQITFPYLLFISLTALVAGVLNSYGRFALPALAPVWLNLALIGAALWFTPYSDPPVVALAWAVFAAGLLQLLFLLPGLAQLKLLTWPRWGWHDTGVRRILRLMVPGLFGSSVAQINLLLDTVLASLLVSGSVSWLYYADRLVEFPLGVFGIALGTVILPKLSQRHAQSDPAAFSATLDWALRWVLLIATPATLALALLAEPLLTTLFQYGAFTADDVTMAALSLVAYAFGLPAFMLIKVLAPGYYARQDTRTPVKIGIIAMVANMGLNGVIVLPLWYFEVRGAHAGLALATAASAFLNAALLWRGLRRQAVYHPEPGWGRLLAQLLLANSGLLLLLLLARGSDSAWLAAELLTRLGWLAALVVAGIGLYLLLLRLVGVELRQLRQLR